MSTTNDPAGEALLGPILPTDLQAFLRTKEWAVLYLATDRLGTILVVKGPAAEFGGVEGRYLVKVQHEVYAAPTSPVVRTLFTLLIEGDPLFLETFINVGDAGQLEAYAALEYQDYLNVVFYGEDLVVGALKRVSMAKGQADIPRVVRTALQELDRIPVARRNFDAAKAAVLAETTLGDA